MSPLLVTRQITHPPLSHRPLARQLRVLLLTLLLILITTPLTTHAAGPLHATPTGTGDCTTWATACTLQTALTTAEPGDEIWLQAGLHKPTTTTDRHATFALKSGVTVYGGFAGTETLLEERDWLANVTVLSGDIDNNDIVNANGVVTRTWQIAGSNSFHVLTGSNTDSTALLDGVTITAGDANGTYRDYDPGPVDGGGMYNNNGSPTLTNVTFTGNGATSGGGLYNESSSPTLINVTFSRNGAATFYGSFGGGLYNVNSSPTLINVTFSDNHALDLGGGMYSDNSSPTLTNVTFTGNSAMWGGGMLNTNNSNATLTNVTFSGNSAYYSGGGIENSDSSPTLTNVTFSGNSALGGGGLGNSRSSPILTNVTFIGNSADDGGGMRNSSSSPTLTNVTFSANSAEGDGGGMNNYESSPTLTNVTFSGNRAGIFGGAMTNREDSSPTLTNVTVSGNSAGNWGGGMYNNSSTPAIRNTIFWNNQDSTGPDTTGASLANNASTPTIGYSLIQGCYPAGAWQPNCGTNSGHNLPDADPLFITTANLRLQPDSPAINAGNNAVTNPALPFTDLDGKPRILGPAVDLGPYETGPHYPLYLPLLSAG